MKKQTKEYLSNGFGSLISNQRAIEAGKSFPWWVAIIIFLIGTFLPVIPITTSISNSSGKDFVSSYNYSLDRDIAGISLDFKQKGYEFTINNKLLSFNKESDVKDFSEPLDSYLINEGGGEQYSTLFYYNDCTLTDAQKFYDTISAYRYKQGTTTKVPSDSSESMYVPNIVYVFKEGMVILLTKYNTTTTASSFSGDWYEFNDGTNLIQTVTNVKAAQPESKYKLTSAYISETFENWKNVFDTSYQHNKNTQLISSTFIFWGVYAGLTLFLGLLIFLLTRGKTNFNRYLKWWQCMLITSWASLSPAILSMIFGFLLTSYAIMFYIVFMGVRIMWMSMKQLSPTYQAQ